MRTSPQPEERPRKVRRSESKRQVDAPVLPSQADLYVPHLPGLSNSSRLSVYVSRTSTRCKQIG